MRFSSLFINGSFLILSLSLTACGQSANIFKGADVQTSISNGDTYISLDAIVSLGSLSLPEMSIPVNDPKHGMHIGDVSLSPLQDGTSKIAINVDFTQISKVDGTLGTSLPNGRELPASLNLGSTTLIGVPLLQNSRIYVGGDVMNDFFVGVAIGIPALDSVVSSLPISLNLFVPIQFSPQVLGVGGLYTSTTAGQNGIGVFVKKSAVTPPPATPAGLRVLASAHSPEVPVPVESVSEYNQLNPITKYKLGRLLSKHATLRVK